MKRISSTSTTFYKKVFPAIWFGFMGIVVTLALTHGVLANGGAVFLLVPCVMGVFGYLVMRKFVWDLADEVYDAGDYLERFPEPVEKLRGVAWRDLYWGWNPGSRTSPTRSGNT